MLAALWLNLNNNIGFVDSWYIFQFSVHVSKQETNSLLVEKLRFHLSQPSVVIVLCNYHFNVVINNSWFTLFCHRLWFSNVNTSVTREESFISLSTLNLENESVLFTITCSVALMWHFSLQLWFGCRIIFCMLTGCLNRIFVQMQRWSG